MQDYKTGDKVVVNKKRGIVEQSTDKFVAVRFRGYIECFDFKDVKKV